MSLQERWFPNGGGIGLECRGCGCLGPVGAQLDCSQWCAESNSTGKGGCNDTESLVACGRGGEGIPIYTLARTLSKQYSSSYLKALQKDA